MKCPKCGYESQEPFERCPACHSEKEFKAEKDWTRTPKPPNPSDEPKD